MNKENMKEINIDIRAISAGTQEQNSSRRPWIKPVFEREPLTKAQSGGNGAGDGVGTCSS